MRRLVVVVALLILHGPATALGDAAPDPPREWRPRRRDQKSYALIQAAAAGNLADVQEALKRGADPRYAVSDGHVDTPGPATHAAAAAGHVEVVRWLIAQRPEVMALKNSFKETPLHVAAAAGHQDVVAALLAAKAPLEATDQANWTPIISAATHGHLAIVRALLDAGALVTAQGFDGRSAVYFATRARKVDCARELLQRGADPHAVTDSGETLLHVAIEIMAEPLVRDLLARKVDPNRADGEGRTPLHAVALRAEMGSAFGGKELRRIATALIVAGADPARKNKQGKSPRDLIKDLKEPDAELLQIVSPKSPTTAR